MALRIRRLRFGMRTLFVVFSLVAIFFAWFGSELRRSQIQKQASAVISQGSLYDAVSYDLGRESILFDENRKTLDGVPRRFLRSAFGDELFGIVKVATFMEQTKDEHVVPIHKLPSLKAVNFLQVKVSCEMIRQLSSHPQVNQVFFYRCTFDTGVFNQLSTLSSLKLFGIRPPTLGTSVPLHSLRNLKTLQFLILDGSTVDISEITKFKNAGNIKSLSLRGSTVVGWGDQLGKLNNLQELILSHAVISGLNFKHLRHLKQLRMLLLRNTPVTDEDLLNLVGLPHLQKLDISETQTTPPGIRLLKSKIPNCQIISEHLLLDESQQ